MKKNQVVYVTGSIKSINIILGMFSVKLTDPKLTTEKPREHKPQKLGVRR